jgi:hypothetical protein
LNQGCSLDMMITIFTENDNTLARPTIAPGWPRSKNQDADRVKVICVGSATAEEYQNSQFVLQLPLMPKPLDKTLNET